MAIRKLYGMTRESVAAWISESEASFKDLEATRATYKDFSETADVLMWTQDPQAIELAQLFRKAEPIDAVVNAYEIVQYFKGEAACLLEHMLTSIGYRRDLYARMLVVCTYEALKTLRRALGRDFQLAVGSTLGEEGKALAREAHSDVSVLFRRAHSSFGSIRDGIAAHREPDAETRRKLLDQFLDWELPQVALAAVDVLQPVCQLYWDHTSAGLLYRRGLLNRMSSLLDELRVRGVLPISFITSDKKFRGE